MTLDLERQFPNGFAAGVGSAAVALPCREQPSHFLRGCAPDLKLLFLVFPAEHRTPGHGLQTFRPGGTAGASPAFTSGGKAGIEDTPEWRRLC